MQQVLVRIPIDIFGWTPDGIPLYGFGLMLFLSFVAAMWIVGRGATREGVDKDKLFDLALPIFACGVIGARIVFMIQYDVPARDWYKFWEGGIVFYGSAVGGWVGYVIARWFWFHKYQISTWKIADIVAPAVCIGLLIGRIGCFLNGCCYGHICPEGGLKYPLLTAPARELVVKRGYQLTAGFGIDTSVLQAVPAADGKGLLLDGPPVVGAIEPGSPAAKAGLQRDDIILSANGKEIPRAAALRELLHPDGWPRGKKSLQLNVSRGGQQVELPAFTPRSLPLYPTQIYESISMALLFVLLMAFFPYRRHYGQVFVVLMIGYAFHRFFNETLRNDTDPVFLNLTLSQVGSLAVLAAAVGLELYLRRFAPRVETAAPAPPKTGK